MSTCWYPGGGKSECYKTLQGALNLLHRTEQQDTAGEALTSVCLNPKSISLGELYGAYNPVSNDWKDGIASKLVREAVADDSKAMKWLVFDGPVDAVWVENLNTVRLLNFSDVWFLQPTQSQSVSQSGILQSLGPARPSDYLRPLRPVIK